LEEVTDAAVAAIRHKRLDGDETRCQFHQHAYAKLLHAQIPKLQKDIQVVSVFLRFWDLGLISQRCLRAVFKHIDPKSAK